MQIRLEALLGLHPDLIVAWPSGNGEGQTERLQALGFSVYRSEPGGLTELPDALRRLGRAVDRERPAEDLAERIERSRSALQARVSQGEPLRVFVQIWHRPLMTVSGRHYIAEVVRLCGGQTLFEDTRELTPTVSREAVLAADPQVILSAGDGNADGRELAHWRTLGATSAARYGNLFSLDPDLISRPTPRLLNGAEEVCQALETARDRLARQESQDDAKNREAARRPPR